jgi:hypothetical protein
MKFLKTFQQINERKMMDVSQLQPGYTYQIYVNDDRTPGGTEEEILNDYNLEAFIYEDGTLSVEGTAEDLKGYLDDYGIYFYDEDVTLVSGDPGWEQAE